MCYTVSTLKSRKDLMDQVASLDNRSWPVFYKTVILRVGQYFYTELWAKWTKMIFPTSGKYTVPGALSPVIIDLMQDSAIYREPNFWMLHLMSDNTAALL